MKKFITYLFLGVPAVLFADWDVSFDEASAVMKAKNNGVSINCKFMFESKGKQWFVANSRDAVKNRIALISDKGEVQGYVVLPQTDNTLEILCYHRTAQAYRGTFSIEGEIQYEKDSFACRSNATRGERVLPLGLNGADSKLNDAIFSPEEDTLVKINGSNLELKSKGNGVFSFKTTGDIGESSEAKFRLEVVEDYYKDRYVPYYEPIDRKRCPKTPTGWMSWNTYFDQAGAEDNLAEARIGQKYLQPFGCEIWSIESWQGNSDKLPVAQFYNMDLEVNEKQFPKGMAQLAKDIRALGFRPGIWMAPYGTGNTEFYNKHKDWFLHDKNGTPIKCWNGFYTLDPTVPAALAHLKEIFRVASEDWGYEFFKIDGMSGRGKSYCAHLYEMPEIRECFANPDCKNPFERTVKAFRDGIGDDAIFLACQGHTSGPEAKYAEMSRTGADIVHPNQPVKWKNLLLQARCTINQIFTHNIVMIADPDTLLVGDLDTEQARVSATIVALPGQLTFFGDRLAKLNSDKMKILQQTLPPAQVRPMAVYPYFSMLPLWNLAVRSEVLGDFNVVAFFNWSDKEEEITASAAELGIADNTYAAYEFWTKQYIGEVKAPFTMKVPARGVRLVRLTPAKDIPQFVGSDRHVAQSGDEIKSIWWDASANTLVAEVELIKDFPLELVFATPNGFEFQSATATGAELQVCGGKIVRANLKGDANKKTSRAKLILKYKKN